MIGIASVSYTHLGTRSANSESSVNYSIQEYVNDSISTLVDASDKNGIPHPNIITESGRSLTAHHSVLIFEVLETATLPEMDEDFEVGENDHELVHELYEIWDNLNQSRMVEAWHDAQPVSYTHLDVYKRQDYKVLSSYGHIRDLKKKEFSIDVELSLIHIY